MKIKMFIISAAAILFFSAGSYGEAKNERGVCFKDTEKLCKDIKPGEGRIRKCLLEHKKDLSKDCAEKMEKKALAKNEIKGKKGAKKAFACMPFYKKGFAEGFRNGWQGRDFKTAKAGKKGEKVCRADAEKLCKDIKPGEGRIRKCLLDNSAKLSDDCKERMTKTASVKN